MNEDFDQERNTASSHEPAGSRLFVGYCRVSTNHQASGGFSLGAQEALVKDYAFRQGGELLAIHVETESGRKTEADRPALQRALAECRQSRAVLLIARLDRLARNVSMIARLMDGRVPFVAVDMPFANEFTIHILAAVAEYEAELIRERIRVVRGFRGPNDGPWNFAVLPPERLKQLQALALQARRRTIERYAGTVMLTIHRLQEQGIVTYSQLARSLNALGVPTSRAGGRWRPPQVRRVIRTVEPTHRSPHGWKKRKWVSDRSRHACHVEQHRRALVRANELAQPLLELEKRGITSNRDVAIAFNQMGVSTLRPGGIWRTCQVKRLRKQLQISGSRDT
jgi:hypothetical protein